MDRESLRPLVEAQFGESQLTVLSEETINAELDDALEGITDDSQVDDAFTSRLANRLLRMNGNVTKDAGTQINEWKKKHPTTQPQKPTQKPNDGEGEETEVQKLLKRIEAMETAQKQKNEAAAKEAIVNDVKKSFKAKYKEAGLEVNDFIFNATMRDLEIPEAEEGQKVNVGEIVKTLERDYIKNLKAAGLGKEDKGNPRFGSRGGGKGESAADRFFAKKGKREGWKK